MKTFLAHLAARLYRLDGWRRHLFAFAAGAASALAFEPFRLFFLLLFGYAALALLIDAAAERRHPSRAAFASGWWFGFGQFLAGLYWIGYAFMVDAADHAWQLPFVAVLFPGALALFPAFAALAAEKFRRRGPARIFVFAIAFGLAEWLRGHLFTGFPWNITAYGWGMLPAVMQSAAVFGSYGLSLLTILFGASLSLLVAPKPEWRFPAAMTAFFALLFAGGAVRMAAVNVASVPGVALRIVQPNIPQAEKYRHALAKRNWRRLVDLTTAPAKRQPTVVIWPEAAPSFLLTYSPEAMAWIDDLNRQGTLLMTGAVRFERDDGGEPHFYNSFYIFGHGEALGVYDKFHLVPFGEYLPYEKTFKKWGLEKLTGIAGSFGRGPGPKTFALPGAPAVGPLICYEILFPGEVTGRPRPDWLVNVTDDSWFGPWAGPRQHLMVARMRAIEEGLPVVRAANTGISAIIDPIGRITASLPLNRTGMLDGKLPVKVDKPLYAYWHFLWFWLVLAIFSTLAVIFSKENDVKAEKINF